MAIKQLALNVVLSFADDIAEQYMVVGYLPC